MKGYEDCKWIEGYEDRYMASPDGRIISFLRKEPKALKVSNVGSIQLTDSDGAIKGYSAQRIIYETFVRKLSKTECVITKSRAKGDTDFSVNNLKVGSRRPGKLSSQDVIDIRNKRASGMKFREIAEEYNVTSQTVHYVCIGKLYPKVGGPIQVTTVTFVER